jgi:hypothetical protein
VDFIFKSAVETLLANEVSRLGSLQCRSSIVAIRALLHGGSKYNELIEAVAEYMGNVPNTNKLSFFVPKHFAKSESTRRCIFVAWILRCLFSFQEMKVFADTGAASNLARLVAAFTGASVTFVDAASEELKQVNPTGEVRMNHSEEFCYRDSNSTRFNVDPHFGRWIRCGRQGCC